MARFLGFAFALVGAVSLASAEGCSSTSSNQGTADGAAMNPSDASLDHASTSCTDGKALIIQASNYDQSCTVPADCRLIGEGNACSPCAFNCPSNGAINAGALAQYNSDIANTPAVATEYNGHTCLGGCPAEFAPCCVGGKCQASTTGQCPGPSSPEDAAADTGPDAPTDACASSACTGTCIMGAHNVSHMVDGCLVWQCCVLYDAGIVIDDAAATDASTE